MGPAERFWPEIAPDSRTDSQRDRDRVLYSGSFARLAEITQVTSPEKGYVFHNRLTHSLKVGQIARRIAELLQRKQPAAAEEAGGIDPDVAEAAGLSHDLGHPPFGHIAEEELDRMVRQAGVRDGFEGNAQSFRIVVRLANSDARDLEDQPVRGLNLTREVLNGVLKYPWAYRRSDDYPKKWGYYRTEEEVFKWVRKGKPPGQRSLIAEIMDWADDITFAIHDLLDFFRAGRIPIDRCKGRTSIERERLIDGMFSRKPQWTGARLKYENALLSLVQQFSFYADEPFADSHRDHEKLFNFSTGLIRHYVGSIRVRKPGADSFRLVEIDANAQREVEVLKQFVWEYVIERPELAIPQEGQRAAIRTVFTRLFDAAKVKRVHLFPSSYQESITQAETNEQRVRAVVDCIAGMTEKEVMHFYRGIQGLGS